MTAAQAVAQINARIAPELKERGDAALAKVGVSPSQAIRALWELAASHAENPAELISVLFPGRVRQAEDRLREERERRIQLIEDGPSIVRNAYEAAGLSWPTSEEGLSYDELKEVAYAERYGTSMGWDA